MKLKKIEIIGFKSFMDRTIFTFPSPITAIVGPNGCGKTNIADAMLWAMGEMRPTHLRGRSMDDVIFNGTENLKPLGMAEVSLTFANDGSLPMDGYSAYSEIMVARRLYRSGESEYLINKVPCRLKDIKDLFLGTGVGVNAYSIIEQGQVEMLINARPAERRSLIEEAAGVTKYKERKRETLLKMERTKQNLLRVQDVIGEVHRQMNALQRQAAQARRYRGYQGEIKELEIGLTLVEFAEHEKTLKEAKEYLQGRRDEEAGKVAHVAHTESELEEFKRTLLTWEQTISRAQEEIYRIEGDIQRNEERIKSLERELQGLHDLKEQYRVEIEGLRLEHENVTKREGAYRTELDDVEMTSKQTHGLLEAEGGNLGELEERFTERERTLEGLKDDVLQASTNLSQLQNHIENGRRRKEEYVVRREKLERELGDLQREETDLTGEMIRYEEAERELARRKETLELEFQRRTEELQRLVEDISLKEAELKETDGERHRLRFHLSSLVDMQRRFEGYTEGVKAIMTTDDTSLKKGVIGVVADLVEVDPRHEVALEAALGYKLQTLLVKGKGEALRSIQYLKERGLGRGSFLPLDATDSRTEPPHKRDARILGPLAEVVKVKEGYKSLVDSLLDGMWLVRDLAGIAETRTADDGVFVTVEGDLWDRNGVLTGGSWDSSASGILARKREIKETEEVVRRQEEGYLRLSQRIDELREKITVVKTELETLRENGYRLEREDLRVRGEIEETRRTLTALMRKGEVLTFELAQIDVEAEQLREDAKKALVQITEGRRVKEEKEGQIEALKMVVLELRQQRDQVRQRATELQVRLASLQERQKNLERSLEELREVKASLAVQLGKKEGQLKEAQTRIQDTMEAEEEVRRSLGGLIATREQKKKSLEGEGEKVKGLREEISAREDALKGLRSELKEIQDSITHQEVKCSQVEMEMRHLAQRIQERYGLILSALAERSGDFPIVERNECEQRLADLKMKIEKLGEVNPGAVEEYEDLKKRYEFLVTQKEDLNESMATLGKTIAEINRTSNKRFKETFDKANKEFQKLVPRLFNGGRGELALDESSPEPGVIILIQPGGKRLKDIDLLSGGEKAMAAIAFIFSLFLLRPTPFCLLDEIDSALDDANIDRFATILKEFGQQSQFILITHNKGTMNAAEDLYGITMETPGVSKVVSVKLN